MSNGNVNYNMAAVSSRYAVDTEATFTCNNDYSRKGCESSTCETSGSWAHSTPTCEKSKSELTNLKGMLCVAHQCPKMFAICQ